MPIYSKSFLESALLENKKQVLDRVMRLMRRQKIRKTAIRDSLVRFGFSRSAVYLMLQEGISNLDALAVIASHLDADLTWLVLGQSSYLTDIDLDTEELVKRFKTMTARQQTILLTLAAEFTGKNNNEESV